MIAVNRYPANLYLGPLIDFVNKGNRAVRYLFDNRNDLCKPESLTLVIGFQAPGIVCYQREIGDGARIDGYMFFQVIFFYFFVPLEAYGRDGWFFPESVYQLDPAFERLELYPDVIEVTYRV